MSCPTYRCPVTSPCPTSRCLATVPCPMVMECNFSWHRGRWRVRSPQSPWNPP